ncbi:MULTISPECIES: hypothetical protein [unclassified Oscillibacter]|uniref:DUF4376 domain-containing protein n=1 Tax=unclassified Oscillibacter TaxID=2629304 RepID=UPI0025FDDC5E|nr:MULTISPECIES: hypothetical protein [unclassified Oscillibacter]
MKIIEIEAQSNGAHRNQTLGFEIPVPDGWAVIPDDMAVPDTFPFVNITVEDNIVVSIAAGVVPEAASPTAAEIKAERSTAIKAACAEAITGGFDADVLGRGMLHYTLTEIQQRDLQTQYAAVRAGATEALWHDSSRVTHEVYTTTQFMELFQTGYAYIISCKIRSDWLEQLAHDLADADKLTEAAAVDWDTELPEAYQTQCDAQIAAMMGGGNE